MSAENFIFKTSRGRKGKAAGQIEAKTFMGYKNNDVTPEEVNKINKIIREEVENKK